MSKRNDYISGMLLDNQKVNRRQFNICFEAIVGENKGRVGISTIWFEKVVFKWSKYLRNDKDKILRLASLYTFHYLDENGLLKEITIEDIKYLLNVDLGLVTNIAYYLFDKLDKETLYLVIKGLYNVFSDSKSQIRRYMDYLRGHYLKISNIEFANLVDEYSYKIEMAHITQNYDDDE